MDSIINNKRVAFILAAGNSRRLAELTQNKPKSLLQVGETTLLERHLNNLKRIGITKCHIVVGYKKSIIKELLGSNFNGIEINYIDNELYSSTGHGVSVYLGKEIFEKNDIYLIHADVFCDDHIYDLLDEIPEDHVLIDPDYDINTGDEYVVIGENGIVTEMGPNKSGNIQGEFLGMSKFSSSFMKDFCNHAETYFQENGHKANYELVMNDFLANNKNRLNHYKINRKKWININYKEDLDLAREWTKQTNDKKEKVFVFGIDGAMPEYIFEEWKDELPNLSKLMDEGCYANMKSTIPPLSAVAWTSIITGHTPADTSIFEYVYRKNHSYNDLKVITSKDIKVKTLWETLTEKNKKSIVSLVPLTWPVKPLNGKLISGFLTPPGDDVTYTYPSELKKQIEEHLGEPFQLEIPNWRKNTKDEMLDLIYKLTKMDFNMHKYLIKNNEWDLFFGVIQVSDLLNHTFWKYLDKKHRRYDPNSKYNDVLKDYYKFVDTQLGELLECLDKDTKIIILSDHGMLRIHNRVNLTDWLIENGYMVLKEPLNGKTVFNSDLVDWTKTKAFAIGAYEGQLFLNKKGREPEGIVEEHECESLIEELKQKILNIKGDQGEDLDTRTFLKEENFQGNNNEHAPDLLIYFDNLHYGCNNSLIGNDTLWSLETAKGSDDAGHSHEGIFIMRGNNQKGNLGKINVIDIVPTILNNLGINDQNQLKGDIII